MVTWYAALCGNGDMSMESLPGPGDDDGRGGVVTPAKALVSS